MNAFGAYMAMEASLPYCERWPFALQVRFLTDFVFIPTTHSQGKPSWGNGLVVDD